MADVRILTGILALGALASGCASAPYDYTAFRAHRPRSLLVLPPLNESTEVQAPYSFLASVTAPLSERGYYVFPVALVDHMMKENGLPSPAEMHQASLSKIKSIINPDAVLYLTLKNYGSKFIVVDSQTTVTAEGKLVDVDSGSTIWEGAASLTRGSTNSNQSPLAMLLTAVVSQVASSEADTARHVSRDVNWLLYTSESHGLLFGPYHPQWDGPGAPRP